MDTLAIVNADAEMEKMNELLAILRPLDSGARTRIVTYVSAVLNEDDRLIHVAEFQRGQAGSGIGKTLNLTPGRYGQT